MTDLAAHPERLKKEVAGELGLIGGLFVTIGMLVLFVAFARGVTLAAELYAIANTLVFVGPGVWYVLASRQVVAARLWVLPICLKVAAVQGAVILILLLIAATVSRITRTYEFVIPGLLALYFVPALAVLSRRLVKLGRVAALLTADGHAFEPVRVQPVLPQEQLVELELDDNTAGIIADTLGNDVRDKP
jgi:hypothetical protein